MSDKVKHAFYSMYMSFNEGCSWMGDYIRALENFETEFPDVNTADIPGYDDLVKATKEMDDASDKVYEILKNINE